MTDFPLGRIDGVDAFRKPLSAADWLALAAAPAFGAMAVWTGLLDAGPVAAFCSAAHASPIGGMGTMYLLMSVIHVTPWLRLLSRRDVSGHEQG